MAELASYSGVVAVPITGGAALFADRIGAPAGLDERGLAAAAGAAIERLFGRAAPVLYARQEHTRLTFTFSAGRAATPGASSRRDVRRSAHRRAVDGAGRAHRGLPSGRPRRGRRGRDDPRGVARPRRRRARLHRQAPPCRFRRRARRARSGRGRGDRSLPLLGRSRGRRCARAPSGRRTVRGAATASSTSRVSQQGASPPSASIPAAFGCCRDAPRAHPDTTRFGATGTLPGRQWNAVILTEGAAGVGPLAALRSPVRILT